MLMICLVFWQSESRYAYKRYAYERKTCIQEILKLVFVILTTKIIVYGNLIKRNLTFLDY